MHVEKAVEVRRSIRSFKSSKVRWDKVLEAIDAAIHAPFAGNINNLKFIIIESKDSKKQLANHCQQDWIADAGTIVVVCSDESLLANVYHERGKIYSRQQAGAAIQNFLLRLTELGYASCWVGAYADELVKQHLGVPEHIHIEAILPIGKANERPKPQQRVGLENVTFWGEWGVNQKSAPIKEPIED